MKYEITKEQIEILSKSSSVYNANSNLINWFPEAFKKELEPEKWYVYPQSPKFITFIKPDFRRFGIGTEGSWFDDSDRVNNTEGYVEATESEVSEVLENEAIKRGFVNGVSFCIVNGEREAIHICNNARYGYDSYCNKLLMNGWCIFENGVWAKPIESISRKEAEKQLGKKIID